MCSLAQKAVATQGVRQVTLWVWGVNMLIQDVTPVLLLNYRYIYIYTHTWRNECFILFIEI